MTTSGQNHFRFQILFMTGNATEEVALTNIRASGSGRIATRGPALRSEARMYGRTPEVENRKAARVDFESGEGFLQRRQVHQSRRNQLLPGRRSIPFAAFSRPSCDAETLSEWDSW